MQCGHRCKYLEWCDSCSHKRWVFILLLYFVCAHVWVRLIQISFETFCLFHKRMYIMVHVDYICTSSHTSLRVWGRKSNFVIGWVIVENYTTFRCSKYFMTENWTSSGRCYHTFFWSHDWGIHSRGLSFMIFYSRWFFFSDCSLKIRTL